MAQWPKTGHVTLLPVAWRLAALLGMSDAVEGLVANVTPEQARDCAGRACCCTPTIWFSAWEARAQCGRRCGG